MTIDVPVMIAGAGPVGLTLGLELSHHGVPCFIAERNATTTTHPKMDVTNCRSMELFRRLGVADRLRTVGVPEHHNMDVVWVTGMSGYEIHRFRYASVDEVRETIRRTNDGSQPLEPNMRISQVVLEPMLRDILFERPEVTLRYSWTVESFARGRRRGDHDDPERRHGRGRDRSPRNILSDATGPAASSGASSTSVWRARRGPGAGSPSISDRPTTTCCSAGASPGIISRRCTAP